MDTSEIRVFFDDLNRDYMAVHKRKEELYWAIRMATSDEHERLAEAEVAYKSFVSDPARLAAVRERIAWLEAKPGAAPADQDPSAELLSGLRGWQALFEANVIEGEEGRARMARVVELESALFERRRALGLRHVDERGEIVATTLQGLLTNESANPDESARISSLKALRGLEEWILQNGFLEIVKARNAFARAQGCRDYFDYKVRKSEGMSPEALFEVLDDFEASTARANARSLSALGRARGSEALQPWNSRFFMGGSLLREVDPYFPFELAPERWTEGFRRLGIGYRGAVLRLDLLEREGKYQNGFCHAPVPAFRDGDNWVPARVNFTSEGRPLQIGSGLRALETLFHEGGHAAHFANVMRNSPCFSQEFAPTSMAYAETQSMICESVVGDPDWLSRHAKRADGTHMPRELIKARIEASQPFRAFGERMILVVP